MKKENILFADKNILVTGGAGSIGRELVRQLIKEHDPRSVRVLDNNESALFSLEQELIEHSPKLRMLIGDVRDKNRLMTAMDSVDIVFHAAALKHVYINEYTPSEAVKTNVIGTQNVIDAAIECNVQKVINISTDKAVNPTSVMGTTKLLAEKLTTAANYLKGSKKTILSSVRFGNVLGSRGSVLPLFIDQIKSGGPITITDERMTRYFMSVSNAVSLIFKATQSAEGGEVFILKMPSIRIIDLAKVLIDKFSQGSKIEIKSIGPRPGEKLHESLLTSREEVLSEETDGLIVIKPIILPKILIDEEMENSSIVSDDFAQRAKRELDDEQEKADETNSKSTNSGNQKLLDKDEIKKIIEDAGY